MALGDRPVVGAADCIIEGHGFQPSSRQAGRPTSAQLDTRVGRMWLYMGQACDSIIENGLHRLKTLRYTYLLYSGDDLDDPILRWEYQRDSGPGYWCRHHLQGPIHIIVEPWGPAALGRMASHPDRQLSAVQARGLARFSVPCTVPTATVSPRISADVDAATDAKTPR